LITPWGIYWTCPCLENGIPKGVAVFDSRTGKLIRDREILAALASSDTTMAALDFDYALIEEGPRVVAEQDSAVVEVEFGECWTDYRPSRPEHFVGRAKIQRNILHFLTAVKTGKTETRVFAIKGDSGIGKSSLIAKLRDRANKSKKPSSVFMFAVDVRAASTPGYVHASFLSALRRAAGLGFGTGESVSLRVTDVSDPLQSDSIGQFLRECERRKQLVVLVLDQFEELYILNRSSSVSSKRLVVSCFLLCLRQPTSCSVSLGRRTALCHKIILRTICGTNFRTTGSRLH